jgi:hypothetical protein
MSISVHNHPKRRIRYQYKWVRKDSSLTVIDDNSMFALLGATASIHLVINSASTPPAWILRDPELTFASINPIHPVLADPMTSIH